MNMLVGQRLAWLPLKDQCVEFNGILLCSWSSQLPWFTLPFQTCLKNVTNTKDPVLG